MTMLTTLLAFLPLSALGIAAITVRRRQDSRQLQFVRVRRGRGHRS